MPYRPRLAQFFLAEVTDEQLHAQFLANKIVLLGGEPTTQPRPVPAAHTNKEMLEAILAAERKATQDYTQRAREAEELGEKGLMVQLEDMVRDESGHAEETERMLRDWPLRSTATGTVLQALARCQRLFCCQPVESGDLTCRSVCGQWRNRFVEPRLKGLT